MSETHIDFWRDPLTGGVICDLSGHHVLMVKHDVPSSDTVYLNGTLAPATLEQIRQIVEQAVHKALHEALHEGE